MPEGRTVTPPAPEPVRLGLRVYLPTLLFGIGQGAIAPVVALSALSLGASVSQAGLVVALLGVGQLLGDVPAGALAARLGEKRAMLSATAVAVVALVVCAVAGSVPVLAAAITVNGFATAVWGLARQSYITEVVPITHRARVLSTLAGARRFGFFAGPFLGGALISVAGTQSAYWIHVGTSLAAAAVLVALPDKVVAPSAQQRGRDVAVLSTWQVVRQHLPVLRRLGTAAVLVGATRASRQAALPLWAAHIGLDASAASLVFGIAGFADVLLFYPAGKAMDVYGRRWIGVPSMLVLGVSLLLLPLAQAPSAFVAVAVLMGIGNGMSSGILMVLAADASPAHGRAQFLGAWRLCSDSGNGAGPLVLASVAAALSLGPALVAMGVVGLSAAAALHRWIPPTPARPGSSAATTAAATPAAQGRTT